MTRWVGRPMPRVATRRLVAGRGRYVDDMTVRGELHAAFLRSPYPHAAFTFTSTQAAAALPGVAAVLTAAEIDTVCKPWRCESRAFPGLVSPEQRPLARDRASYQGEPVAMIVAESRALAEDALELIEVDWRDLPAMTDPLRALERDAQPVHPGLGSNLAWEIELRGGDPEAAFAEAALVVDERFTFHRHTGVSLESRGVLASWDPAVEALELRISHQMPHQLQGHLAEFLSVPLSHVRVICGDVGGGFGVKMHVYPDEVATCAASRLLGRPVRFIADRMEALLADIHAREHVVFARMAVDRDGHILGFHVDDVQGLGAYSVFPRSSTLEGMGVIRAIGAPYGFAHFNARLRCVLQNKVPTGQFRGVGTPIACAVTERLIDLAAKARDETALDFRRRNLLGEDAMPMTNPAGHELFGLSQHACLDRMETLMDLPRLQQDIATMRAAGRWIGLGYAAVVEFTAAGAQAYGRAGVPVAAVDTVVAALELSGEVTAKASVSEIGQGIQQGLAQVIADAIGLDPERVSVLTGDTLAVQHGGGAWASRGAAIGGEAALGAGRKLRGEILAAAAALLQATPESLDIRSGSVVDSATGADRISLEKLAQIVILRGYELPAGVQPQLTVAHHYRREPNAFLPNNGIQASLVEVDWATGIVRALRHWVVLDCGRLLNPLLVQEQIRGGVVMGLGEALFEECSYDASGQFVSGTLADYLLPMACEMPDIMVAHVETPYEGSLLGAKGAGEAGTCGAPAAVLNAVNDALAPHGAQIATLPITPVVVLRALGRLAQDAA
jgi:aerobic carbon-monoxide dehydrogenase large subunit